MVISALTRMFVSRTTRTCGVHLAVDEFHDLALVAGCDPVLDAFDGRDRAQNPEDRRTHIFRRQILASRVERRDAAGLRMGQVLGRRLAHSQLDRDLAVRRGLRRQVDNPPFRRRMPD